LRAIRRGRIHQITMCSRIGGQAASVPEDKSRKRLPGHIRTTQPHRGWSFGP